MSGVQEQYLTERERGWLTKATVCPCSECKVRFELLGKLSQARAALNCCGVLARSGETSKIPAAKAFRLIKDTALKGVTP